jgi:ribosomal protein L37AE/L43A
MINNPPSKDVEYRCSKCGIQEVKRLKGEVPDEICPKCHIIMNIVGITNKTEVVVK